VPVIVTPGGAGSPRFVISTRLALSPPSRSFRLSLPSVKAQTNLVMCGRSDCLLGGGRRGEDPAMTSDSGTVCQRQWLANEPLTLDVATI
jgi:hypothetical protein